MRSWHRTIQLHRLAGCAQTAPRCPWSNDLRLQKSMLFCIVKRFFLVRRRAKSSATRSTSIRSHREGVPQPPQLALSSDKLASKGSRSGRSVAFGIGVARGFRPLAAEIHPPKIQNNIQIP